MSKTTISMKQPSKNMSAEESKMWLERYKIQSKFVEAYVEGRDKAAKTQLGKLMKFDQEHEIFDWNKWKEENMAKKAE